jgi:hypothetical protein
MTEIEARAAGGYVDEADEGSVWGKALVPVLAALLVLAFGLAMVSLTGGSQPAPDPDPPAAETGVY